MTWPLSGQIPLALATSWRWDRREPGPAAAHFGAIPGAETAGSAQHGVRKEAAGDVSLSQNESTKNNF